MVGGTGCIKQLTNVTKLVAARLSHPGQGCCGCKSLSQDDSSGPSRFRGRATKPRSYKAPCVGARMVESVLHRSIRVLAARHLQEMPVVFKTMGESNTARASALRRSFSRAAFPGLSRWHFSLFAYLPELRKRPRPQPSKSKKPFR